MVLGLGCFSHRDVLKFLRHHISLLLVVLAFGDIANKAFPFSDCLFLDSFANDQASGFWLWSGITFHRHTGARGWFCLLVLSWGLAGVGSLEGGAVLGSPPPTACGHPSCLDLVPSRSALPSQQPPSPWSGPGLIAVPIPTGSASTPSQPHRPRPLSFPITSSGPPTPTLLPAAPGLQSVDLPAVPCPFCQGHPCACHPHHSNHSLWARSRRPDLICGLQPARAAWRAHLLPTLQR